jgi:hypothetical protein
MEGVMAMRTGVLSRDHWAARINELLLDIGKETDEYADEIFEMLLDMVIETKDERQDNAAS